MNKAKVIGSAETILGVSFSVWDNDAVTISDGGGFITHQFAPHEMLNLFHSINTLMKLKQSKMTRAREYWAYKLYDKTPSELSTRETEAVEKVVSTTKGEFEE